MLRIIILLIYPTSRHISPCKWKHILLWDVSINLSTHSTINSDQGTDGRYTETSPYSDRSTTALDDGNLILGIISSVNWTFDSQFLITSKQIKCTLVTPKDSRPLHTKPHLMLFRPHFTVGLVLFRNQSFSDPNSPIQPGRSQTTFYNVNRNFWTVWGGNSGKNLTCS